MPLFEEKEKTNPNQNQTYQTETCGSWTSGSQNCGFETSQKSSQTDKNQKPSGIIATIGQLLPLAPFVFEQFTGQKVPQMTGTVAEMQMSLVQIQSGLQTIVNNQQQLAQRITVLETKFGEQQTKLLEIQTNANQHLTNLVNQFNSLRLTHTKEQKRIEYGNNSSRFEEENPENY